MGDIVRYGSCFSGVEAATLAFESLGWAPAFFAEVEPFPAAVLAHHWPHVPNLGDVTKVDWAARRGTVDVLIGGPPCQDFSVAGKRAGLDGARGNLLLTWAGIINAIDPLWSITENVPGWLSIKGNAFGTFLGALVAGGGAVEPPNGKRWGSAGVVIGPKRVAAWRVLNAQHFGVPQRRRRVFVVTGRAGSWADPVAVLFERKGVRRDCAESGRAGQETPGALGRDTSSDGSRARHAVIAHSVTCHMAKGGDPTTDNYVVDPILANEGNRYAHAGNNAGRLHNVILRTHRVRRLTPRECERLQGMPDDHVLIRWRGKLAADGPRYKAIGNSMAVPVIRWIGKRIAAQGIFS